MIYSKFILYVATILIISLFYPSNFTAQNKIGTLEVHGLLQPRFTYQKDNTSLSNNNFDIALGKLTFKGNALNPNLDYFFQIEGSTIENTNKLHFTDWWLQYTFIPELNIKMGRFLLPYSRQFYTYPGELLFPDVSETDLAFNLPRAIGVMVSGSTGMVSYNFAVLNGIRGLDSDGEINPKGSELSVLGRIEIDLLNKYGYLESDPNYSEKPAISVGVALARNEVDYSSGLQNQTVGDKTTNITADLGFRYMYFSFQTAYYSRINKPSSKTVDSYGDHGYYLQSGYYLIPGTIEIAARLSKTDFDRYDDNIEYSVGLNYYRKGHDLKVQFDYSFIKINSKTVMNNFDINRVRLQTQLSF